jgi:hypothetical protein
MATTLWGFLQICTINNFMNSWLIETILLGVPPRTRVFHPVSWCVSVYQVVSPCFVPYRYTHFGLVAVCFD